MSTEYAIVNETKKVFIDPGRIGNGNAKEWGIVLGDAARLLAYAFAHGGWSGDIVAFHPDSVECTDELTDRGFVDVTGEMVGEYNYGVRGGCRGEPIELLGDDGPLQGRPLTPEEAAIARNEPAPEGYLCAKCEDADLPEHALRCPKRKVERS